MSKEFVIGIDIGTTSVKACVFNINGDLISEVEKMNTFHYPQQGWVEQDPVEIERSAVLAVREAIDKAAIGKDEILSIGFSAAMHSLICVNKQGKPISPALIWADGRSYAQAENVLETIGQSIYLKT